jgi:hypothetical protein
MSKQGDRIFTFDVEGVARNLFTTYENNKGTVVLNLLPKGSPNFKQFETPSAMPLVAPSLGGRFPGVAIKQSRYSVHTSDESPNRVNLINLTHEYENGEIVTSVNYTTAIKQTNMFAPIITRRFDDVRLQCYDVSPSKTGRVKKLADTRYLFCPVVGVFVGASGRRFDCPNPDDFQFKQFDFTHFSLLFVWSFILLYSRKVHDFHSCTTPETGPQSFESDAECVGYFKFHRELLKRELVQSWIFDPNARRAIEMTKLAGYFREARTDAEEFKAFMVRLQNASRPLAIFR